MSLFSTKDSRPLGKGIHCPGSSITDKKLSQMVSGYKKAVASRYRALMPDEIGLMPSGKILVSRKVDGEQWCLIFDEHDGCFFANPSGRIIAGTIPILEEAAQLKKRVKGRTVVAGELYALKDTRRPRHGDLAQALAGEAKAEVDRLQFAAFDLVAGGDDQAQAPLMEYADRLDVLERIFKGGKLLNSVQTETVSSNKDVAKLFDQWVDKGDAEGIVARAVGGITFKVKPAATIDGAVIGYTLRTEDETQVSSFLIALLREDDHYHLVGHCGNLGNEHERRDLLNKVKSMGVDSNYSEANSKGALYRFIKPKLVAEVLVTDVQAEKADGDIMPRMVLSFEKNEWKALRIMPGVSLLHPRLVRLREDKQPVYADVPISQVLDRVLLPDVHCAVSALELPASELLRREVFTKVTKGVTAVRKLVVWKTHKKEMHPEFPEYVVHWTDYSPGRKEPLQRTVRLAPTEALATEIADELVASEVKKGWAPAK